jgi:hypothetical protein
MEYGDTEPSHLPSSNALRVMKYNNNKNRLDKDEVLAVTIMKGE